MSKAKKKSSKIAEVMQDFREGNLKYTGGREVTNFKEALSIALEEAREDGED